MHWTPLFYVEENAESAFTPEGGEYLNSDIKRGPFIDESSFSNIPSKKEDIAQETKMPVGALLSGILTPLIVNSLLGTGNKPVEVSQDKMTMMQHQPTFNVNFYNQDTNHNQDRNDVHDNGNLNYQQGNSHLTAHGNLHNTRGPQQRTSHYGQHGQLYPLAPSQIAVGPQFNPYIYPPNPYAHHPPSALPPPVRYPTTQFNGPYQQSYFANPQFVNPNFAHLQTPPQLPTNPLAQQQSVLLAQIQEATRKVESILEKARSSGQEEVANERLQEFVQSGGTEETLSKLLELAQDPMYDPSQDPDFDPLEGSLNYEELPFYTEDAGSQDAKFNPVSALGASNIRFSRRKRDVGGKFRSIVYRSYRNWFGF